MPNDYESDHVHVGPGEGKGKSMTRSLPRGILEATRHGGMADGVDSVVDIAGTVGLARVSKTGLGGNLRHDAEGGGDKCGVDTSFADFEHGSTNLCF